MALVLAAAAGCASQPSPGDDVVRLRFAWPAGLDAEVESTLRTRRTRDGATKAVSFAGTYRLRTYPEARGLRLAAESARITAANERPVPGAGQEEVLAVAHVLGVFPPTRIVDAEAELVAVEGSHDARFLLDRPGVTTGDPQGDALLREIAGARLSTEAGESQAREDWLLTAYVWDGTEVEIGQEYAAEIGEMEVGPGVSAPLRLRFDVRERLPCRGGQGERRCVRIVATMRVDPDAQRRGLLARARVLSEQLGEPLPEDAPIEDVIHSVETVKEVELLVEEATLLPHRTLLRRRERIEAGPGNQEKVTEIERRYAY